MGKADTDELGYRKCAGMAVFNQDGKVFVGRRFGGPEQARDGFEWQMPQGGINKGEDAEVAAVRELFEETSMQSLALLGTTSGWLRYDLPDSLIGKAWKGRYRGQAMKWFAFRFLGPDDEINVHSPGGGHHKPEFADWRWENLERTPELIVPFKRDVYAKVCDAFADYAFAR